MGIQRVRLEDHRHIPLTGRQGRHVTFVKADAAPVALFKSRDQPQQSRLAAAAGADQHRKGPVGDLEVDSPQNMGAAEALLDSRNGHPGHGSHQHSSFRPRAKEHPR